MARIAIFSKYFGYSVGGAEKSVLELLKTLEKEGNTIVAIVVTNLSSFGADSRPIELPDTWEIRRVSLKSDTVHFRFVDYFRNRHLVGEIAKNLSDTDELYSYGYLAPAVINSYAGKTCYMVRDEYGLGWNINYYSGLRKIVQFIYHASESLLRYFWHQDLLKAISKSRLMANSMFIADELRKLAPSSEVEVIYPQVDLSALQQDYLRAHASFKGKQGIVIIGDNILKGGDIARKVASQMPEAEFYLFDRKYSYPEVDGNIHLMPWQSPGKVFSHAAVVMVPSRWAEAFGRVVLEAQFLKIPVIASARGGIPEVMQDHTMLVDAIDDPNEWVKRIRIAIGK